MAFFFKGIPFRGIKGEKSDLRFKEIIKYSLPLVLASFGGMIFRASNQFYISRYFGSEVFAEFSNGFIEIPFVHMITGATASVLMPVFSKAVHEKANTSQITNLWQSALLKSVVLIYPIVIYMLFYSNELISIVFSESYASSSKFFAAAMIINFFNVIHFTPLLLSMGKGKFFAWLQYSKAFALWGIQYIAILVFNTPMSIAVSYVIIEICGMFIPLWYLSGLLKVSFSCLFPLQRIFIIALHSFLSMFLVNLVLRKLLPDISDLLFVAAAGFGYLGILFISSKWFKINYMDILRPLLARRK